MTRSEWKYALKATIIFLLMAIPRNASAQKRISCPDGEHIQIDLKQLAIQYDGSSLAGTLSSLSVLGARLEVTPKKLQEAAAATQQWDEFLKGLASGYNSCAITREQYAEGVSRIYPRLKDDATDLAAISKLISKGQQANTKRVQTLLDTYYADLRRFAELCGKDVILERIEVLSEQVGSGQGRILRKEDEILARLSELGARDRQALAPAPADVQAEMSELRKTLMAKAADAEKSYNWGISFLAQYRFKDAIPQLQQAVTDVPLPIFYLALGRAYRGIYRLDEAESVLQEGLRRNTGIEKKKYEFLLDNGLGLVLLDKGELAGALDHIGRALRAAQTELGDYNPDVATIASNLGTVFYVKGNLPGALKLNRQALTIHEKAFGLGDPEVATDNHNIGQILREVGNLESAHSYAKRAYDIYQEVYGPNHPMVAASANNIAIILQMKGDLNGALALANQAREIDERFYGPNDPRVGRDTDTISLIYRDRAEMEYGEKAREDLKMALSYSKKAYGIAEQAYGRASPDVGAASNNLANVLAANGDLIGAERYSREALRIAEKLYGEDNPAVSTYANNLGQILRTKGNFDEALAKSYRALSIDEKTFGADHPMVARDSNNIGTILLDKGDLDGAFVYTQRALAIVEKRYGADNPKTKEVAANLERINRIRHK